MTSLAKQPSRWKDAHANLSRVLIASLMKKFSGNQKEVAHELGITQAAVRWNIQTLGLDEPGEIDRYAMPAESLGPKKPQGVGGTARGAAA